MQYSISRLFRVCFLLVVSLSAMAALSAESNTNIDMFVGEVKTLNSKSVSRVAVGAGSVIRAEVITGGELLVIAEAKGSSSLRLWYSDGNQAQFNIRVSESDPEQRVLMQDMIRIKVQMVEFNKNATTNLGIDWSLEGISGPTFAALGDLSSNNFFRPGGAFGGANLPTNIEPFTTYFGISTSLNSLINFLSIKGDAITIAEPTLSVVNGGVAKFLSGGELPYAAISSTGEVDVEFKEYGIKLDIVPRANSKGDIYAKVLSEVSLPDAANSVNGLPALKTRRTESELNVRTGQTIAISGLLDINTQFSNRGFPVLHQLPFVGKLFGNESSDRDVTELVVFITPEIVKGDELAGTAQQKKLLETSRTRIVKTAEQLNYSIME